MAPTKPFRTYSRGKKSSVNSVEAFDILFTKNLAQRKLAGIRKKNKYEVKDLPAKVKCVLKEESSIHVNFNDTFDKICSKPLSNLKNDSTGLQKVGSCSNKTTENNTWDSWFNRATPTGAGITNSLEIEHVGGVQKQKSQNVSRSSRIVLRSHTCSQSNQVSLDNLSRRNNSKDSQQVSINIQCSKLYTRNNVHLFPCIRQNPTLHSSTPLRPKKRDLLAQTQTTISPIKAEDKELRKSIVESFSEIKQWSSTAPKFLVAPDNPHKPSKSDGQTHKEIISFNLDDFEDFLTQLNMSSDEAEQSSKSHGLPRQSASFPKQQPKSVSSTNGETFRKADIFVNSRRGKFSLARKRHSSRSREAAHEVEVVLLVSFDESKLKSENSSGRCLAEESKNKQLVVNLTRQSLDKLKTQFNPGLSLLTPIVRKNVKACRKFSSNWGSSSQFLCSGSNKTSHPIRRSKSCDSIPLTVKEIDDKPKISAELSAIRRSKRLGHQLREVSFHNLDGTTQEPHLKDSVFSNKTSQDSNKSSVQFIENSLSKKPYVAKILIASATDNDLNRLSALSTPPAKSPTTPRSFDLNNLKSNLLDVLVPRISPQKTTPSATQYTAQDLSDVILRTPKLPLAGYSSRIGGNSLENSLNNSSVVAEKTETDDFDVSGVSRFSQKPIIQTGKAWRRSFMSYKKAEAKEKLPAGPFLPNICEESRRFSCRVMLTDDIGRRKRRSSLQCFALSGEQVENGALPAKENGAQSTAQKLVLKYCNQRYPLGFSKMYPNAFLQNCKKIGEGVYGEVFLHTKNSHITTVMKIIPIEGSKIINDEKQKSFAEILPEIAIVSELSNLRKNSENQTEGFCEVLKIRCVQGEYPKMLLKLWNDYDEQKGSENDRPDMFGNDQLYIVLELANAGQDLADFEFNNAMQADAMFQQVAYNLAVAEEQLQFEHRDLHWGNVLLKEVPKTKTLTYKLQGKTNSCPSHGVQVTIIDFTLSRMTHNGVTTFTDLGNDPDLFLSEGDYQFEIYRLMKERNKNDWQTFMPYSNILWLHYIVRKALKGVRYKNARSKVHKRHIKQLQLYESTVLDFSSAREFVSKYF